MTPLAEVVRTEAEVASLAATEHALPNDMSLTVLLAISLTSANLLEQAVLTQEVLRLIAFITIIDKHFLFTIYESAKVGLLTLVALVERTPMVGELLSLLIIHVTFCFESGILENPLPPRIKQCLCLDLMLQTNEWPEFFCDNL